MNNSKKFLLTVVIVAIAVVSVFVSVCITFGDALSSVYNETTAFEHEK